MSRLPEGLYYEKGARKSHHHSHIQWLVLHALSSIVVVVVLPVAWLVVESSVSIEIGHNG